MSLDPVKTFPKIEGDGALAVDAALSGLHLVDLALLVLEGRVSTRCEPIFDVRFDGTMALRLSRNMTPSAQFVVRMRAPC
ncbi:hypothetical protein [Neorhizobium sp. LjRoot104]|uniref:hypothetical protein n=1 Tax=Neorhizobium sp. LjRoot104 TaxID=3342254 RepID=UPI003ED08215